jgi:TIR domain
MDLDSIPAGTRFAQRIDEAVAAADAVVVLVGPDWVDVRDRSGSRRLDDPQDWVRNEVAAGLRSGKPVFPVLVGGARQPVADELPQPIRDLVNFNSAEISEKRWDYDVAQLIHDIREGSGEHGHSLASSLVAGRSPWTSRSRRGVGRWALAAGLGAAVLIAAVVILVAGSGGGSTHAQQNATKGQTGGVAVTGHGTRVFSATGTPATFSYPSGWGDPVSGVVGPKGQSGNFEGGIYVASGAPETSLHGRYQSVHVTHSTQTVAGLVMSVVDFDTPHLGAHQRSWVFTVAGSTWSLNCWWLPQSAALLQANCARALNTLKIEQ